MVGREGLANHGHEQIGREVVGRAQPGLVERPELATRCASCTGPRKYWLPRLITEGMQGSFVSRQSWWEDSTVTKIQTEYGYN